MPGHMRVKAKRKKVERSARPSRVAAIAMAVVAVAAVGILAVARQPSQSSSSATLKAAAPTTSAAKPATTTPAAKPPATAKQEMAPKRTPVDSQRAKPALFTAPAVAATASAQEGTVSVTGCLERSDRVFRLTDTEGTSAPTARSWKSGFLKKRSANLTVVSAANSVQLSNYAGQRVKLVGTLSDRELHARSAVTISRSCS